jgi:hypothetical protein
MAPRVIALPLSREISSYVEESDIPMSPGGYWTGEGLVATSSVAEATLYVANAGSAVGRPHEKGDSVAKTAAGAGGADSSVADDLRRLGVQGVLVQMAERGQLLALKCEMPQCYHHKGRGAFDPVTTPRTKWAPSPDHYPILKSAGGHLVPENVRLSHIWCNNRDYGWRTQIRTLLAKGKSLAEIAETLNRKDVPPGPRHEPMDGRHGAQGLRVLVRVRRWVPLCAMRSTAPACRCIYLFAAFPLGSNE